MGVGRDPGLSSERGGDRQDVAAAGQADDRQARQQLEDHGWASCALVLHRSTSPLRCDRTTERPGDIDADFTIGRTVGELGPKIATLVILGEMRKEESRCSVSRVQW
jgi:hypothetical protein